ncbi:hypothetical protein BBOV_III004460 [Babesia bovis T2Bo]|uniref:Cytoplasmic tRNA 2-thiolation protein 1 n=1 Tax=Babesia bovis TaxID=5865 RepID=A7AN75_BABBO|nr:hypothetical protein BBOV_III004460 [Babesia bovis T2Bo]EDO08009.1 hypothetical protein BBOV_III004460 [Babesia bovis T2Bo]|eukprot:XP_001611577.1 PP-loop family protein [Babesia bovis T2Bo]
MKCARCNERPPTLRRCASRLPYCRQCFINEFEKEVYDLIEEHKLIVDGDVVCIGVSGGKDSSVLAHVLATLKERYHRKWTLYLLAADEGIKGYRDDSLGVVMGMSNPNYDGLKILNFKERFGFDMDEVVSLIGQKNNCTVCGTFRRQILEIGARMLGANKLCTGHNIDDNAETVLLNICRNDLFKLARNLNSLDSVGSTAKMGDKSTADLREVTASTTSGMHINNEATPVGDSYHSMIYKEAKSDVLVTDQTKSTRFMPLLYDTKMDECDTQITAEMSQKLHLSDKGHELLRIKPLMHCYEKEIVMYARYLNLEYFSTECIYAPEAYRGYMRTFIKQLEAVDPRIIQNITYSSEQFYASYLSNRKVNVCKKCGIEGINDLCKACILVEKLTALRSNANEHIKVAHSS